MKLISFFLAASCCLVACQSTTTPAPSSTTTPTPTVKTTPANPQPSLVQKKQDLITDTHWLIISVAQKNSVAKKLSQPVAIYFSKAAIQIVPDCNTCKMEAVFNFENQKISWPKESLGFSCTKMGCEELIPEFNPRSLENGMSYKFENDKLILTGEKITLNLIKK
jgi:hypothetical protein